MIPTLSNDDRAAVGWLEGWHASRICNAVDELMLQSRSGVKQDQWNEQLCKQAVRFASRFSHTFADTRDNGHWDAPNQRRGRPLGMTGYRYQSTYRQPDE